MTLIKVAVVLLKYIICSVFISILQKDILAESPEILKLGLLFGEDVDATTTDLPEVLSFQHKLIQEYLAAIFITENIKVDMRGAFLEEIFPTWAMIENHREVVQFACGMLAETDASPITNHVAKVLSQHIHKDINNGGNIIVHSLELSLFDACLKEGGVPLVTPYLTWYPACGCPLAEVLENTKLAVITDIDKNDPLKVNASHAQIIVDLRQTHFRCPEGTESELFDRLWQALHSIPENVIAWQCSEILGTNTTKVKHFSGIKHMSLTIPDADVPELEDLALSIDSWGPQPPLIHCYLGPENVMFATPRPIPMSLMTALSSCTHLKHLTLSYIDLHDKLSILMASPPSGMRELGLCMCSLHAGDIAEMTEAFREDRLTQLELLGIPYNPVGEAALGSLLQVISTRPHALKHLTLWCTGVDEAGSRQTKLSEQFVNEWKNKLPNIDVPW